MKVFPWPVAEDINTLYPISFNQYVIEFSKYCLISVTNAMKIKMRVVL